MCLCAHVPMCLCAYVPMCLCAYVPMFFLHMCLCVPCSIHKIVHINAQPSQFVTDYFGIGQVGRFESWHRVFWRRIAIGKGGFHALE